MKDANYKTKRNEGGLVSLNMTRLFACKERSCVQGAYCVKHSNANMALGALTIFIHSTVLRVAGRALHGTIINSVELATIKAMDVMSKTV